MNRALGSALLAGVLLAAAGCGARNQVKSEQGFLFTFYAMPRKISVGESRVGLRVQDRDYRIIGAAEVRLQVVDPEGRSQEALAMAPGMGRDFRAQVLWPLAGNYRLRFRVVPEGQPAPVEVEFIQPVSK
jgi:hypothetical protein